MDRDNVIRLISAADALLDDIEQCCIPDVEDRASVVAATLYYKRARTEVVGIRETSDLALLADPVRE